jgi:hypothetical protein
MYGALDTSQNLTLDRGRPVRRGEWRTGRQFSRWAQEAAAVRSYTVVEPTVVAV